MPRGRPKLRTAEDERLQIDLHRTIIQQLRKLMRKRGNTELKPFIEEQLMNVVMKAEESGEI